MGLLSTDTKFNDFVATWCLHVLVPVSFQFIFIIQFDRHQGYQVPPCHFFFLTIMLEDKQTRIGASTQAFPSR